MIVRSDRAKDAEIFPGSAVRLRLTRRFGAAPGVGSNIPAPSAFARGESHSQMEESQAEDRHNPLPHIALLTTALKSAYENTAFLPTRTSAELRVLLVPGGRE